MPSGKGETGEREGEGRRGREREGEGGRGKEREGEGEGGGGKGIEGRGRRRKGREGRGRRGKGREGRGRRGKGIGRGERGKGRERGREEGKGEGRGAQAKQERCFVCRKRWKDEVLGVNEGDDVDCLFFILARSLTDQQKGKCCVHKTKMALIFFSADVILCFYISACACSLMPPTPLLH